MSKNWEEVFGVGEHSVWTFVTDSSGNWYRIPLEMQDEFILLDSDEYKELDFLEIFEKYTINSPSEYISNYFEDVE